MSAGKEPFRCSGTNYSVTLHSKKIELKETKGWNSRSFELPVESVKSVIVERKSVIPFAAVAALSLIATALVKYNAFWFLVNMSPEEALVTAILAAILASVFMIATLLRAFFVNVSIAWEGEPQIFRIRYVSARRGRSLARRILELSG
jgi:hypothetical protein